MKTATKPSATRMKNLRAGKSSARKSIARAGNASGVNGMSKHRKYLRGNWDDVMSFEDFCQNDQRQATASEKI